MLRSVTRLRTAVAAQRAFSSHVGASVTGTSQMNIQNAVHAFQTPQSAVIEPIVPPSFITEVTQQHLQELPAFHNTFDLFDTPFETNAPMLAIKRTFQPSVLRRKRKHGFRRRRLTRGGRKTLTRRYLKGRWRASP